MNINPIH